MSKEMELNFAQFLSKKFPTDNIISGARGDCCADIFQKVFDSCGKRCGVILWEFKYAKIFSRNWIRKLREDQIRVGANIAIFVTDSMPKELSGTDTKNRVYVVSWGYAIAFSVSLRADLIENIEADEKVE